MWQKVLTNDVQKIVVGIEINFAFLLEWLASWIYIYFIFPQTTKFYACK